MAAPTPALAVIYSATARKELEQIWTYNADYYNSAGHATDYVDFFKTKIKDLSTAYLDGRKVETKDRLRYIVMKRNTEGHGHIAVYRISKTAVRILHIFHTARDWENKVKPRQP